MGESAQSYVESTTVLSDTITHPLNDKLLNIQWMSYGIREYGSTLYVGLSRFTHRANARCNSLAGKHFRRNAEIRLHACR